MCDCLRYPHNGIIIRGLAVQVNYTPGNTCQFISSQWLELTNKACLSCNSWHSDPCTTEVSLLDKSRVCVRLWGRFLTELACSRPDGC